MTGFFRKSPVINQHDDVTKWKYFPGYWRFATGIHWSSVNSPYKGQWREALLFSLICALTNGWVNHRDAGDLRDHRAHCDVTVMRNLNSLRPGDTYMHPWTRSSLVQVMAYPLFGVKQLPEPMLTYCQLEPWESTSVKSESKWKISKKECEKCYRKNVGHAVQVSVCNQVGGIYALIKAVPQGFICTYGPKFAISGNNGKGLSGKLQYLQHNCVGDTIVYN